MTEWLPVPDYEGYLVSDDGRISRILKPVINRDGRPTVSLHRNGIQKTLTIHQLVANAFLADSKFEGSEVCHNDGDPANNHVDNLRWDTRSANHQDTVRHGKNRNALKTHCPYGHAYTEENTSVQVRRTTSSRKCRTCARERSARYTEQRKRRVA